MSSQLPHAADYQLVQRCLAGDQEAWAGLFQEHQPRLLARLRRRFGGGRRSADLAEEAAALFWTMLVERDYRRLRCYDPQRGALATFLNTVAGHVAGRLYRTQVARRDQAQPGPNDLVEPNVPLPLGLLYQEFEATLTPRERRYWRESLLAAAPFPADAPPQSAVNCRKLKQRIRAKLNAFLGRNLPPQRGASA